MTKIRWGILSTAKIAVDRVIPAMQQAPHCEVVAIASRNPEKGRQVAGRLGIPRAYGSYEELLADANVQAVYNPLPNHLHVPWSIRALEAGKHVLCEKPIGVSAAEGQKLVDAAKKHPRLKVMEAFMYRHHPQWKRAGEIVAGGGIGELRTIQAHFSYFNNDPANIRNQPDLGGGGLMDIGCYPISLSRLVFAAEPKRVFGLVEYDPQFKTDRLASAILDFGRGTAIFTCSTQLAPFQRVNIFGTKGRIEIEIPFMVPNHRPCRLWHQHDMTTEETQFDVCDQYGLQGDVFSRAIIEDTPVPTPIEDAVANMKVIEAIVASGKSGTWASV